MKLIKTLFILIIFICTISFNGTYNNTYYKFKDTISGQIFEGNFIAKNDPEFEAYLIMFEKGLVEFEVIKIKTTKRLDWK